MIENLIVVAALLVTAAIVLSPRLTKSEVWRATVTPLASIIGSGFLVSLPLFAGVLGDYALIGMTALVVVAYLLGGAIRFNILHGEPLFAKHTHSALDAVEDLSHLALALAYFISVTYYLTLFAAFLLKGLGTTDVFAGKVLTSCILFAIGIHGLLRGLHGLETIEEYAVGLKLAAIAAVLAALAWLNIRLFASGTWHLADLNVDIGWTSIRTILGLLIVVQGFETSRFLKGAYPPELRVRTMRDAQLLSGAIYLVFFLLATVTLTPKPFDGDVAAVTDILKVAASWLPLVLDRRRHLRPALGGDRRRHRRRRLDRAAEPGRDRPPPRLSGRGAGRHRPHLVARRLRRHRAGLAGLRPVLFAAMRGGRGRRPGGTRCEPAAVAGGRVHRPCRSRRRRGGVRHPRGRNLILRFAIDIMTRRERTTRAAPLR